MFRIPLQTYKICKIADFVLVDERRVSRVAKVLQIQRMKYILMVCIVYYYYLFQLHFSVSHSFVYRRVIKYVVYYKTFLSDILSSIDGL